MKQINTRVSHTRAILLDIFEKSSSPLSVAELLDFLRKKGKEVNKTTVYREIQFLLSQETIVSVFVDETHSKYELNINHHHHLVCKECGKIEEVEIPKMEKIFPSLEKKLKQKNKFTHISHTLEFFGFCAKCSFVS